MKTKSSQPWKIVTELVDEGSLAPLLSFLTSLSSGELALALSRLTDDQQARLLTALPPDQAADLLVREKLSIDVIPAGRVVVVVRRGVLPFENDVRRFGIALPGRAEMFGPTRPVPTMAFADGAKARVLGDKRLRFHELPQRLESFTAG